MIVTRVRWLQTRADEGMFIMTYNPSSGDGKTTISKLTAGTTITDVGTDQVIELDATTAAFNVVLPAVAGFGYSITFKRTNAGTNKPSFKANGTETIDGSTAQKTIDQPQATFTLTANQAGTGWDIV